MLGGAEAVGGSWVGGWAVRAWRSMSCRRTSGSVESDQDWVQSGAGQGILGILGWAGGFHCVMCHYGYHMPWECHSRAGYGANRLANLNHH